MFVRIALFVASAAFVLWRNSEVGVLVDISWILNNATRIARGDVPYVDFQLAQTPGEFLMQAALIRLFGPEYPVQIAYAAIVGGLGTVMTYAVVARLLREVGPASRTIGALLAIPLIPLGVYAIYPHPFYDPDACVLAVAAIWAVVVALDRSSPAIGGVAGVLLTLPLAMKQNIGGPFLVTIVAILAVAAWRRTEARRVVRLIAVGLLSSLAVELVLVQFAFGLDRYVAGTVGYAAAGRGVGLDRVADFAAPAVVAIGGSFALRWMPVARRVTFVAGALLLLAVLFVDLPVPLLFAPGAIPPLLVLACVLAAERMRVQGYSVGSALPFVLLGTTLGAVESQGLQGSTYGIFPLLVIAVACALRDAVWLLPARRVAIGRAAAAFVLLLSVSGAVYTVSNLRLRFVDVNAAGPIERSSFPTLAGLSAHGPYVADLDAILVWARDHIPANESVAFVPGEDPVYFALDRSPPLPTVLFLFGDVATPYTPSEIAQIADERGLAWVVVKDHPQLLTELPDEAELVRALTSSATLVQRIGPYRVYRR